MKSQARFASSSDFNVLPVMFNKVQATKLLWCTAAAEAAIILYYNLLFCGMWKGPRKTNVAEAYVRSSDSTATV